MNQAPLYANTAPYPPVKVCSPNTRYAKAMLTNSGGINSEMSAISLYLYNSVVTKGDFQEISECFMQINMVEMHHLDIFSQLADLLGADPRLWSQQGRRMSYWSPGYNEYTTDIVQMLHNAINAELLAIEQYRQQICWITDHNITNMLQRIILDEEHHIAIFRVLLKEYCL